jgi:hypothetical protein
LPLLIFATGPLVMWAPSSVGKLVDRRAAEALVLTARTVPPGSKVASNGAVIVTSDLVISHGGHYPNSHDHC